MTDLTNVFALPTSQYEWQKNIPYKFNNLIIIIEYLAGDTRTKVKDTGAVVTNVMPVAYGEILYTTDQHGEKIDMYLASNPDFNAPIYVIDQINPGNQTFDEHKVMLGFSSIEEVVHTYDEVFTDGSGKSRLGAITTFTPDLFTQWLCFAGSSLQPANSYKVDGVTNVTFCNIQNPPRQKPFTPKPIDEAGGVVINLPNYINGPQLHTSSSTPGVFEYTFNLYSGLDMKKWSNAVDTLCRTLDCATPNDIFHIRIASPGGSVILMGRIISAFKKTQAKVITYAEGEVASAATTIWANGHERHILPGAYFMQHMSSQLLQGKTTDISAKSTFCLNYIANQLQDLVAINLFTPEEVAEMIEMSADVYITGREAVTREQGE
jgi:ATP-dependent protease ClpP protease subunit